MKKRILVILLTMAMLFSDCLLAHAETSRTSGEYTYRLKGNGTAIIVDFAWKKKQEDIYIPSMIDGYTVTAIDDEAFAYGRNVSEESVVVVIPNTITMIGDKAFFQSPVSAINIPLSVQSIGKGAFAYCDISHFSVAPGHQYYATIDGVLYCKKTKSLVAYPQKIGRCVCVPEGICKIDDWACAGISFGSFEYESTKDVYQFTDILPSSIKEIGNYAFTGSTIYYTTRDGRISGDSITLLPDGVNVVGEHAFENSTFVKAYYKEQAPERIYIGSTVSQYGAYAFANCRWYDGNEFDLYISSRSVIDAIGEYAFANAVIGSCMNAIEIVLPASIHTISAHAFENTYCVNATKWESSTIVAENAFYNTTVYSEKTIGEYYQEIATKLVIPGTITFINSRSFAMNPDSSANSIVEIDISEGITHIGESAFSGMSSLQKVSFPETIISISDNAFAECDQLAEVTIPFSVTQIGDNAFVRTKVTLCVEEGSYAELWASENGYSYKYSVVDNLDWLNN